MINFFKRNFIFFIVFITGAAVLIIEVTAIRILSPYFGNTIFTVSSVLGTILGALSLGYYLGGKIADKRPHYDFFFLLIFLGGIFTLLIYFFSRTLLLALGLILDLIWGPLFMSFVIFFFPAFFLGMLSPYAIKLKTSELEKIGSVSGKIYFWSTMGSIFGNFFTGFYLIPNFGTSIIIITTSFFLILLGFLGILFFKKKQRNDIFLLEIIFFILAIFTTFGFTTEKSLDFLFKKEGLYSTIFIKETKKDDKAIRVLAFDFIYGQSGIFLESDELPFEYTKYYRLYKIFNPTAEKALFIGGGAYTTPRRLLLDQTNFKLVEVVEIEPELYELAKKYFRLPEDDNRLINYISDGRRFLAKNKNFYDLIFVDAFSFTVPHHFITKEFFLLAKERLSEKGIFLMNIVGNLKREEPNNLILVATKTFCNVFKNCYLIAIISPENEEKQNFILLGIKNEKEILDLQSKIILENEEEIIKSLPLKIVTISKLPLDNVPILTDNFAPIEYLSAKMLKSK